MLFSAENRALRKGQGKRIGISQERISQYRIDVTPVRLKITKNLFSGGWPWMAGVSE